jgi:hypothetical protein
MNQNLENTTVNGAQETDNKGETEARKDVMEGVMEALNLPVPETVNEEEGNGGFYIYSDSTAFGDAYSMVSGDGCAKLTNAESRARLTAFTRKSVRELCREKQIGDVLKEAVEIHAQFDKELSFSENVAGGMATRLRIEEGRFLRKLKDVVKAAGENWTDWVGKNITNKTYRVVRQYILLAETDSIDRYAPLGKELLVKIVSELKNSNQLHGKDPVGKFLAKHGIGYDPEKDKGADHLELMRVVYPYNAT